MQSNPQQLEEARNFYQEAKYSDALIIFQDLAFSNPNDGILFFEIAKTYIQLQQPKVALANFEKAMKRLNEQQHYTLRKELGQLFFEKKEYESAAKVILPAIGDTSSEKDLLLFVKYLLMVEDVDSCELAFIKNIEQFPSAFDGIHALTEVEAYKIERLGNRKDSIFKALKVRFTQKIEEGNNLLLFIQQNVLDHTADDFQKSWNDGLEAFDYAENIPEIAAAKEQLSALIATFEHEKTAIEAQKEQAAIAELRTQHLKEVSQLNDLETELLAILPKLPATSLKAEIPAFLNVVKDFKNKTRLDDLNTVNRTYANLPNLITEGNFFKAEAEKAIERMLQPSELETALVKAQTEVAKREKRRKKRKKQEDDPVIILESKIKKRRKKGRFRPWLFFFLVVAIAGAAWYYTQEIMQPYDGERRLITGVWLRARPNNNGLKIKKYTAGSSLKILAKEGEWLHLKANDGNIGYMLAEYFLTPPEYELLHAMLGNRDNEPKGTVYFDKHSARFKKALVEFYKENEWISDVSTEVERQIYGNVDENRELRQVFPMSNTIYNTMVATDLTGNGALDFVCLIRGEENEQFFVQTFDTNDQPLAHFSYLLEGKGYDFSTLLASSYTKELFLGSVAGGTPVKERLTTNAIRVRYKSDCELVFHFKNGVLFKSPQEGCD